MGMTIGKKFGIISLIVSILLPVSIIINWIYGIKTQNLAEKNRAESAVFAIKAKDMQIAVIQVQQWLTDISATRAAEGYNDGFEKAKAHAAEFKRLSNDFIQMFTLKNDQGSIKQLEKLNNDFDAFYEMGKKMANVYISEGPKEGNKMMKKFDPLAESITIAIVSFLENQIEELEESMKTINSTVEKNKMLNLIVGLAIWASLLFSVYLITRGIKKNIKSIFKFTDTLAEGDFTSSIDIESQDEIGQIAVQLTEMKLQTSNMLKGFNNGTSSLNNSAFNLFSISEQMKQGAEQNAERASTVASAAEEMSANMNSVAVASEQASTNINMVATSVEEMSATINEIAQNTEKARGITSKAVSQSQDASLKVDELGIAAEDINKVTETITDISEQTNLLALNATIEAARAGEAGKGFAVVANEIKELARQTAEATQEIKEKINGIQSTSSETINRIKEITQINNEVSEIVTSIANSVEEQSVTTQEIAGNVTQASSGIQEVNKNVSQSSAVANNISKEIADVHVSSDDMTISSLQINISTQELQKLAKRMTGIMEQFKLPAERFDIGTAKGAHLKWRLRLEGLLHGKKLLNPEQITNHHECDFGRWYYGPESQKLKEFTAFSKVGQHHEKMHVFGCQIVEMVQNGENERASSFMVELDKERGKLLEALNELYLL